MNEKLLKPHFKLMASKIEFNDAEFAKKVSDVYMIFLVDITSHTYLAELRPSYAAHFVEYQCGSDVDDDTWGELKDMEAWEDGVSYFHVSGTKFYEDLGEPEGDEWERALGDADGDQRIARDILTGEWIDYFRGNGTPEVFDKEWDK